MCNKELWFYSPHCKPYIEDENPVSTEEVKGITNYLKTNYILLYNEFRFLWEVKDESLYGQFDNFDEVQFPQRSWKKIIFKVWGIKSKRNIRKFDSINKMFDENDNIVSSFIARLAPNSKVLPHCGETNAIKRVHLGLKIPECESKKCSIKILNKTVDWKNGEVFAFVDAFEHEAWNHTNEYRYILIVDIIRPQFKHRLNYVKVRMITIQILFALLNKIGLRKIVTEKVLNVFIILFYIPVILIVGINNRFGVFKF